MDYRPKAKPTKRKKQPKSCPNPLFLKWLEQWRDEAKSKESKLQYVYSKAITSLKKYPLPLESGKEAVLLEGIGPSIAKKLDEELEKHQSNLVYNANTEGPSGLKESEHFVGEDNFLNLRVPPPCSAMPILTTSNSCSVHPDDVAEPKPKKKRKSINREYIPAYRSGPYAMIITLFKASERSGYKGYMIKREIQLEAQPLSETSFAVPEPDSHYTAWSSMSTLVKKGLVVKAGNPARYHLSDSGNVLAEKLLTATSEHNETLTSPQPSPVSRNNASLSSPKNPTSIHVTETDTRPRKQLSETNYYAKTNRQPKDFLASYRKKVTGTELKPNQSGLLQYWFIDGDGQCVEKEDQASVIVDDEISLGFLIKCKHCELEKSGMKYKLDHSRPSQDGYVFAFLASECIGHNVITTNTAKANAIDCPAGDSDDDMLMRPLFQRITKEGKECFQTPEKASVPVVISPEPCLVKEKLSTQPITKPVTTDRLELSDQPSRKVVPGFELKPGSFEIILCVDFIEITGGGKAARKDEMVKELRMNGVQFDVRKLNVGDFLWIAKEKMTPIPGQLVLPTQQELVLDYIIERKRMDDLCSSIKDGRFKEQKFRLLNSGLRHPVYLVEDFGSANFLSMPEQTLEQSIVNTQVGQDFFVKRTRDTKESAAYLTLMTRYLQTEYNNKTLKAIKRDDVELVNVDENQLNTFLLTFQELNDISLKNRILTVGEVFGKQLLQIPGVAVEKVVTILESYPTLKHLLDAYEEQTSEKEKEGLLSGLKFGKNQRKIGPAFSKSIYQLYYTQGALS